MRSQVSSKDKQLVQHLLGHFTWTASKEPLNSVVLQYAFIYIQADESRCSYFIVIMVTVIVRLLMAKEFDICTVVSVNGTLVEDKMRRSKGECAHFSFNKCPIYTHATVQVSNLTLLFSHETVNSAVSKGDRRTSQGDGQLSQGDGWLSKADGQLSQEDGWLRQGDGWLSWQ